MHDRMAAGHPTSHQYVSHQARSRCAPVMRTAPTAPRSPAADAGQTEWQAFLRLAIVLVLTGIAVAAVQSLAR